MMSPVRLLVHSACFLLLAPLVLHAEEPIPPEKAKADESAGVLWYDLRLLDVEGQGFSDTKAPYDRLPAKAEDVVRPPVWSLSHHSSGLCARFVTDSPEMHCRWALTSPRLAMPHMPATGVSGVDLYVKHEGKWRWLACGRPTAQTNSAKLVSGIPEGSREYLLYLPLYNGVSSVEIGLPKDRSLAKAPPREKGKDKPIVFWGTSITQGGCASRPGMVHTAILGRRLNRPVINLGFSGNGRMEPEVARLLAEIDAAAYVVDCLPNIGAAEVAERTEPLVHILHKAHPETPIVLVEDRSYSDSFLVAAKRDRNETSRKALRAAYENLKKEGVANVYYLEGEHLLGEDNEGTVDSSHPTDLGFWRQADAFEPVLREVSGEGGER